ncbi:GTP binding 2 [Pyrrhoderma noxium]|uniref:GTP binding 2 n=1 Tax=Pyrrhoderma noxium TaxID=2282107 RepID=A0A286UX97_9AGAM|nr:GTP binding 2 [Pyrrhoderma noxium]
MFGESESESPRTGSPWDGFLSKSDPNSPIIEPTNTPQLLPKLVPEVEEGNVEYKLRLLNPTTERFTRLVTQLNWRLHEGGGQAYYELGVADSGQLVGLTKEHLDQSLQTLDEMAGEIGASVIVVKEIELPATLLEASRQTGAMGKIADGAMRMRKTKVAEYVESPGFLADTESQSSPQDKYSEYADKENDDRLNIPCLKRLAEDSDSYDSDGGVFICDLEIQSVHKQRPHRRRTPVQDSPAQRPQINSSFDLDLSLLHVPSSPVDVPIKSVRKTEKWRRRELNRTPKLQVPSEGTSTGDSEPSSAVDTVALRSHSKALDDLADAASLLSFMDAPPLERSSPLGNSLLDSGSFSLSGLNSRTRATELYRHGLLEDKGERRFIVEALVVRKMSVEETFLDFVNI